MKQEFFQAFAVVVFCVSDALTVASAITAPVVQEMSMEKAVPEIEASSVDQPQLVEPARRSVVRTR